MGWWTERVVPHLADRTLSQPPVMRLRAATLEGLGGAVLEIGFGSGLNAGLYPAAVDRVDAVEPSDAGWQLSAARRADAGVPIARIGLDGAQVAVGDASYDAVLSTFTLCTVADAPRVLAEVRRVLRPGGWLFFLEHGLSPDAGVARWQRRLEPLQRRMAGGCHLTRDLPALLDGAGLEVRDLDAAYLPGPGVNRPWTWVSRGRALRTEP